MNRELKKAGRKIRGKSSRFYPRVIALWTTLLFLGAGAGFAAAYAATMNDTFELRDTKEKTIPADGEIYYYNDPGAVEIEFGRDISGRVRAESDLEKDEKGNYIIDASEEGIYFISYTVDSPRYKSVRIVRTFIVGGAK